MNLLNVISGFNIFGLHISFYGLIMAVSFVVAFLIANKLFRKNDEFKKDITLDLLLIIFPLSILGARTYYVIFSETSFTFLEFFVVYLITEMCGLQNKRNVFSLS